jgi:EAL domain-containing protein (putative c-di-GMP-specific phosphodiesterase class I)
VESEEQLEVLRKMGCEEYSGYLLAEASTAIEFERQWLRAENVVALKPRA